MLFQDKLKALSEILSDIDKKLGFTKFTHYVIFIVLIYGIFNFREIVKVAIEINDQIEKKEHERRLELRDSLMTELNPLLIELRTSTGASRLLYFEYHNSTENFVGIPFKFANLVLANQNYGCPDYDPNKYKDINSGLISRLYTNLKKEEVIINKGIDSDSLFYSKYPEVHEFFSSQDGSIQQAYINVPGVKSPVGMIILEWVDDNDKIKSDYQWERIKNQIYHDITRINGIITKYTP